MHLRKFSLGLMATAGLAWAHGAAADSGVTVREPIAAQPVSEALSSFSRQTGLQVVWMSRVADGVKSAAVPGGLSSQAALSKLLEATGLQFEFLDERTVTVFAAGEGKRGGAVSGTSVDLTQERHLAQADTASSQTAAEDPAKSPAGDTLEEIVVTAQRREEKLLETPISIGVLTGQELDRSSSRSVADVLNQVGGVSIIENRPGDTQIAIRGVLSEVDSGTSAVGYYLDEVPFAFINSARLPDTDAFDLARVEVLRGPQGTLYGANALSGVVRVLTNEADLNAFEAKVRARGSSTDHGGDSYAGNLALNAPLIPGKLAVRAVAGYSDLGGFIDSTRDGGKDINTIKAQSYRLKVNYRPIENLDFRLGYTRYETETGSPMAGSENLTTPYSASRPDNRELNVYNLVAEYRAPAVSVLSSTSYLDNMSATIAEIGAPATPIRFLSEGPMHSFSQEVRFASHLSGPWQWSAGAMYKEVAERLLQDARPLLPGVLRVSTDSQSYAAFGEATRSFSDGKFDLTAGLRYFSDSVHQSQQGGFFPTAPLAADHTADFEKATWRVLMSYKPQDDAMVYGSVATGFRSGRHQSSSALLSFPNLPGVEPDSLLTYELGAKGVAADGALIYDLAVYYTDWEDIQQTLVTPLGFQAYVNAGTASGVGVDTGLSYRIVQALTLHAGIGWNDLKLDEDVFSRGVVLFEKGARVNNSPEWTGSVGSDLKLATPMPNVDFVASTDFVYGSARLNRFLTGSTVDQTLSDPFRMLEASAGIEADRWSLQLYASNLLNDDSAVTSPVPGLAFTAVRARPRTIGLQAMFTF